MLFEKFLAEITVKEGISQQLLFPLELSFTKQELTILKEIKDSLINVGFAFESLEEETESQLWIASMKDQEYIVTSVNSF